MTPLEYIFDKIDKNMDFRPIGEQFPYLESFPTCSIPNSAEAGYLIHGWGDSFSTYAIPECDCILFVDDTNVSRRLIVLPLTIEMLKLLETIKYDEYDLPDPSLIYSAGKVHQRLL